MIDKPLWTAANLWNATPFQQTQMDWVYASQQIALEARVKNDNLARVAEYENRYSQYAAAMDNHPELAASQVPPEPAFAMVVKVDPSGWAEEVQSTERVCPTKTYVPPKPVELGTAAADRNGPYHRASVRAACRRDAALARPLQAATHDRW